MAVNSLASCTEGTNRPAAVRSHPSTPVLDLFGESAGTYIIGSSAPAAQRCAGGNLER